MIKQKIGDLFSFLIYRIAPIKSAKKLSFYKSIIPEGRLFFDIGSHMGDRVDAFLEMGANKIVAVEPNLRLYNKLQKRYKNNDQVTLVHKGMGSEVGSATFHINTVFPFISTFADKEWRQGMEHHLPVKGTYDNAYEVEIATLDQLIASNGMPDFIKIDVEGWEHEVLIGLSVKVPMLSFEFINFHFDQLTACIQRCQELGYSQFNWSMKESFVMANSTWQKGEDIIMQIRNQKSKSFGGDVYVKA